MKEAKEYSFEKRGLGFEYVIVIACVGLVVVPLFYLWKVPLIFLAIGWVPMMFLYMQYLAIKAIRQFNKYDDGKRITISADGLSLTYIIKDDAITINSDDVEWVAIYDQRRYTTKSISYNYIVIYTVSGQKLLITNFTMPMLIYDKALETFLRKKPRRHFKKALNYINEHKFKLS